MVTPQNTDHTATGAEAAGSQRIGPMTQPRVAPIKNEGTISPPLESGTQGSGCKIIFIINAHGGTDLQSNGRSSACRHHYIIGM